MSLPATLLWRLSWFIEGLVSGLGTLHCDFISFQFLAAQSNSFVSVFSVGKVNIAKPCIGHETKVYEAKKLGH